MLVFSGIATLGRMAVSRTQESDAPKGPFAEPRQARSGKDARPRDLYGELKPLWWALLLVMVAPIQRSKAGTVVSRWDSWSGVLTLLLFAYNFLVLYNVFPVQYKALKESDTFPEQVFASLFIMSLNVHLMIPLTAWPFGNKLAKYLNDWTDFQTNYAKVSGRQLELHLWQRARILAIGCLLTMPQTFVQFMSLSNAPAWHAAAYVLVAVHSMAVVGAWHCNCAALRFAASRMAEDFVATVQSESLPVHIRRYRKLWGSLQKLSQGLSSSQSAILLHVSLGLMSMNLVSAFGVLGAVVADIAISRVFTMIWMASTAHVQMIVVCSAGYHAANAINMAMRKELLSLPKPRTLIEHHEVTLFLQDMAARPASIQIIGYLDIDRLMYVKIVSAMARNFLVLLQFAYTGAKAAVRPTEMPTREDFYDFLR